VVAARQEVEFRRTGDVIDDHRQHGEAAQKVNTQVAPVLSNIRPPLQSGS